MVESRRFIILLITSHLLTLSRNWEINARHDNSVISSLLDISVPTTGMSQGKTLLWQTPYTERTPSRRLLITMLLRVPRFRMQSCKTFWEMVPRFGSYECTFPGRISIFSAKRELHNRGHLYPRLSDAGSSITSMTLPTPGPMPPSSWCPSGFCGWEWVQTAGRGLARLQPENCPM